MGQTRRSLRQKKALGKENTETFALFRTEKINMKAGTHQKPWITFSWISWTTLLKNQKQPAKKCKNLHQLTDCTYSWFTSEPWKAKFGVSGIVRAAYNLQSSSRWFHPLLS